MSSPHSDHSIVTLTLASGAASFTAPFPLEVVSVTSTGNTNGDVFTITATGTGAAGSVTPAAATVGGVVGTINFKGTPGVASTSLGANQPNDTGVGYRNYIGRPPTDAPVAVVPELGVLTVTSSAGSATTKVTLVVRKK